MHKHLDTTGGRSSGAWFKISFDDRIASGWKRRFSRLQHTHYRNDRTVCAARNDGAVTSRISGDACNPG
ncbi:MAG: hypothetical protein MnENMB40S_12570 [Rhizobiaceae bacterium MnEN-MB40S]|nr:MAG: hypothetical protein MnENMB40S_12570 [Rhizobiaceae bacterium MnEN-MB40S]